MKRFLWLALFAFLVSACTAGDAVPDAVAPALGEQAEPISEQREEPSPEPSPTVGVDPSVTSGCAHVAPGAALPAHEPKIPRDALVDVSRLIATDLVVGTGASASAGSEVFIHLVSALVVNRDNPDLDRRSASTWDEVDEPWMLTLDGSDLLADSVIGMRVGGRRMLQVPGEGTSKGSIRIVDLVGMRAAAPSIPEEFVTASDELQLTDLVVGDGCEAAFGDIVSANFVGLHAQAEAEDAMFGNSWIAGQTVDLVVGQSPIDDYWNRRHLGLSTIAHEALEGMRVGGERIVQVPSAWGGLVLRVHLEALIEAPLPHTLTFEGPPPSDIVVTTLIEGSGEGASADAFVETDLAVILHNSGLLVQSTWASREPDEISLRGSGPVAGLVEAMVGIKVGEVRQVIIPATSVRDNDGEPPGLVNHPGLDEVDALVFVVAATSIRN